MEPLEQFFAQQRSSHIILSNPIMRDHGIKVSPSAKVHITIEGPPTKPRTKLVDHRSKPKKTSNCSDRLGKTLTQLAFVMGGASEVYDNRLKTNPKDSVGLKLLRNFKESSIKAVKAWEGDFSAQAWMKVDRVAHYAVKNLHHDKDNITQICFCAAVIDSMLEQKTSDGRPAFNPRKRRILHLVDSDIVKVAHWLDKNNDKYEKYFAADTANKKFQVALENEFS